MLKGVEKEENKVRVKNRTQIVTARQYENWVRLKKGTAAAATVARPHKPS